jgi:hypothetical protein
MTTEQRRYVASRWLSAAKNVAVASKDPTALAVADRLAKDGVFALVLPAGELKFDLPNSKPAMKRTRILISPVCPEDSMYAEVFGEVQEDEASTSFLAASFQELCQGIMFRADLELSEFFMGSLMLHEGHHACRIPGQPISRLNVAYRAHIELEAFLLQERVTIAVGGKAFATLRSAMIECLTLYLKKSGNTLFSSINFNDESIAGVNELVDRHLIGIWGPALSFREKFMRTVDMLLFSRFEMIRQQFPSSAQQDAMKKIVALMYQMEEQIKGWQMQSA